ncbi:MAG: DUF1805 domain-containing protein [Candidatus Hodarchaeaceae archaeon]|nr:DUF1805 domain-containing protein [Candidatus Hodarchaeaceae archaeon]MDI6883562.1 DUF1805 domain-containing protein [Hadesarchaea archaeon]
MIETKEINLDGSKVLGIKIELPQAPLLLLVASRGYVMCSYLNADVAEKLGQAAALVAGVKTFDDVLNAKIVRATSKAKELGVREGMLGREALKLVC